MITQRELDIAQLEAKDKTDKLFKQWGLDFLGGRAKRGTDGSVEAEDSGSAQAEVGATEQGADFADTQSGY